LSEISHQKYPPDFGLGVKPTARAAVGGVHPAFLAADLDKRPTGWHGKLLTREMVEPPKALDELVESAYRPTNESSGKLSGNSARPLSQRKCGCARADLGTVCVLPARAPLNYPVGSGRDVRSRRMWNDRDARHPVSLEAIKALVGKKRTAGVDAHVLPHHKLNEEPDYVEHTNSRK